MEKIKITQGHINKYVANTDEFWKEFQQSLSAPFHPWNEFKNQSLKQWINSCRNDAGLMPYLNLLFEYPILKGEFLLVYSDAMLLTNYRLIMNDNSTGINNIPLKKLKYYGEKEFGEKIIDKVTKDVVEYSKNGKIITLEWTSIGEDIINNAKARNNEDNFEKEQLFILENSVYELKKYNSELELPKIEIPEQQDTSINVKEKIEKLNQEQVDKYIADTESFWKEYHKSLGNSFSIWNEHKEVSFNNWVSMCWKTEEMTEYFNLLFQFPILKGEFPIGYASGMILTNFRLLINDSSNNSPSIPLTKIKKYSLQDGGIIEIENQSEKLQYDEMIDDEFVTSAISRCKKNGLDELQEKLITNSLAELNNDYSNINIPKTEMYPLTDEQKNEMQKSENHAEKFKSIKTIYIVLFTAIGIASLYFVIQPWSSFQIGGSGNLDTEYLWEPLIGTLVCLYFFYSMIILLKKQIASKIINSSLISIGLGIVYIVHVNFFYSFEAKMKVQSLGIDVEVFLHSSLWIYMAINLLNILLVAVYSRVIKNN